MHKTITVTIGGALFVIEEQAYKALEQYLASIRAHFASFAERDEIVSDIEDRIAEEFGEKLSARKKTINEKDVEELIKNMGTVEDFKKFDAEEPRATASEEHPAGKKIGKLYRSSDDQVIGGVCAGIATFFGIDALWVRIGFVVLTLLNGIGILVYIVLWAIVPEAKTPSEKVEMSQGHVTLSAIQQKIEETMPKEKRDGFIRNLGAAVASAVRGVAKAVGAVIGFVVPLAGRILGLGMAVGASVGVALILFVTLAVVVNPGSPYIGLPIHEILGGTLLYLLAGSAFMAAFIPLLFFIILGVSLMSMRSAFSSQAAVGMLTLWLMALVIGGVTLFTAGPHIEAFAQRLREEHSRTATRTFDIENFDSVIASHNIRMNVSRGREHSVSVTAPERFIGLITAENRDGTLVVDRERIEDSCVLFCQGWGELTFSVVMPELETAESNGVSRLTVSGFSGGTMAFKADGNSRIEASVAPDVAVVDIDGVSKISLKGEAPTLRAILTGNSYLGATGFGSSGVVIRLDGVSRAYLSGTGQTLKATLNGNSRLEAFDFAVTEADMALDGVSRAMVHATGTIKGMAQGHSRVTYRGEPASVDVHAEGISRVDAERDEERVRLDEEYSY